MSKKKKAISATEQPAASPRFAPLPHFTLLCVGALAGGIIGLLAPPSWLGPNSPTPDQENVLRLICALIFAAAGAFVMATVLAVVDRSRENRSQ